MNKIKTIIATVLTALITLTAAPATAQIVQTKGTFFIDSNSNGQFEPGEGTLVGQRMWVICDFGFDGLPYTGDDVVSNNLDVLADGTFFSTRGLNQCYITLPSTIFSTPPQNTIQPVGYEPSTVADGGNRMRRVATFQYNNIAGRQQETSWVTDTYTVVRGTATTVNIGVRLIGTAPAQPYRLYTPLIVR